MLPICISIYLKLVPRYKLLILDTCHPDTHYICVSKDVRNHGYFSKPEGVLEQQTSGNTAVDSTGFPAADFIECLDDAFDKDAEL